MVSNDKNLVLVNIEAFDHKDTSVINLRTPPPPPQLLDNNCQYREEDFKNKILSQKEYIISEKLR